MKIGIISDTHGDRISAEAAIEDMGDIDLLIHAGDTYEDAIYLKNKLGIEVVAVSGNTDFSSNQPSETSFRIGNTKIFLTHGHKYNVKYSLDKLYYRALEKKADVVIFGHSHIPLYVNEGNIIFVNPGSTSKPRGGSKHSYGIMTIKNKKISIKLQELV